MCLYLVRKLTADLVRKVTDSQPGPASSYRPTLPQTMIYIPAGTAWGGVARSTFGGCQQSSDLNTMPRLCIGCNEFLASQSSRLAPVRVPIDSRRVERELSSNRVDSRPQNRLTRLLASLALPKFCQRLPPAVSSLPPPVTFCPLLSTFLNPTSFCLCINFTFFYVNFPL